MITKHLTIGLTLVFVAVFLAVGGCGLQIKAPNPFQPDPACTVYKDLSIPPDSPSVIVKYIPNPCAAQNIIVSVARAGVVLEAYQVEEFVHWTDEARQIVMVGASMQDLKLYVGKEITKLNRKFGGLFFIVSDLFIALPDQETIVKDDVTIINAALDDVVVKVNAMAGIP